MTREYRVVNLQFGPLYKMAAVFSVILHAKVINGTTIPSNVTSLYLDDNVIMGFVPHPLPSEFLFSVYGKPYVWHANLSLSLQINTLDISNTLVIISRDR